MKWTGSKSKFVKVHLILIKYFQLNFFVFTMAFFRRKKKVEKNNDIKSPLITTRIKNFLKCKQRLHEKFLKTRNEKKKKKMKMNTKTIRYCLKQ